MSIWTPREMPRIRDQAVRTLELAAREHEDEVTKRRKMLPVADLFWATENMTGLAISAGRALTDLRWQNEDRPSVIGMMIFDGGIPGVPVDMFDFDGEYEGSTEEPLPIDAVSWSPVVQEDTAQLGCFVAWWGRTDVLAERMLRYGRMPPAYAGSLLPICSSMLPADRDIPISNVDEDNRPMYATLQAAWALMAQKNIAETGEVEVDRRIRRAYARSERPAPSVRLVDLRRQYRDSQRGDGTADNQRRYRHRWIVSGHWRDQAHGQGRTQRKRIWIADHIKGPDGAPVLATERVNVWRR